MSVFEKTFPAGTLVSVVVRSDGKIRVKARVARAQPAWLKLRSEMSEEDVDELIFEKIKELCSERDHVSNQELRSSYVDIFEDRISREQYDDGIKRLELSGKLQVFRSKGGRGCKTQIIPVFNGER